MFILYFIGKERFSSLKKAELINLFAQNKKRYSNSHRGRLDIIADILLASQNGTKKTYLMYHCNLSFRQLTFYLDFLLKTNFLLALNDGGNQNFGLLRVTEKGKRFLRAYENLKALMT